MRAQLARAFRWTVPVLVAAAFALALIGEDLRPAPMRELLLHWHQRLGLLALVVLLAAIVTDRLAANPGERTTPRWHRVLDRSVEVVLAVLLLLQPLAGWLLASAEGRLAAIFGWPLPPLLAANTMTAEYVLIWHGLQSAVILLVAALHIRLRASALIVGDLRRKKVTARRET